MLLSFFILVVQSRKSVKNGLKGMQKETTWVSLKFYPCICPDSKGSGPGFEAGTSGIWGRTGTHPTATSDFVYEDLRKEGSIASGAKQRRARRNQLTSPYLKCAYIFTFWQEWEGDRPTTAMLSLLRSLPVSVYVISTEEQKCFPMDISTNAHGG